MGLDAAVLPQLKRAPDGKTEALFETGYGPSGLPHIGTFGEVARTSMVRRAFEVLTEGKVATRLLAFSDDMDGLRKVPDNIPNKELVAGTLRSPSISSEKASSRVAILPSVRTSKARRTMLVRATSPKVPICGRPEGP